MDLADDLLLSQEVVPQIHRPVREISRNTEIPRSSVGRVVNDRFRQSCDSCHFALDLGLDLGLGGLVNIHPGDRPIAGRRVVGLNFTVFGCTKTIVKRKGKGACT